MKELFLENLAIFSKKNMGKSNIFAENQLKKYSKIRVLIFQKYSKIEVIYEVKISVCSKSIPKSRIPKPGFYCTLSNLLEMILQHRKSWIHRFLSDLSKTHFSHFFEQRRNLYKKNIYLKSIG